ncbi:MAG: hypothetical protein ACAH59_14215 [Pseudobdellovibrionaceae bacterium]
MIFRSLLLAKKADFCDFGFSGVFFAITLGRRSYGFYDFVFKPLSYSLKML